MNKNKPVIALLGNPNSGKSSLFNYLTGLNQKIGNFPGVTVEKKTGNCSLSTKTSALLIDLPGTYSIYPKSMDERVVFEYLNDPENELYPDCVIVVVDASNLRRHLLLFTQLMDMGLQVIMALNMVDVAIKHGIDINIPKLSKEFNIPVIPINARTGEGVEELKTVLSEFQYNQCHPLLSAAVPDNQLISDIKVKLRVNNRYRALQIAHHHPNVKSLSQDQQNLVTNLCIQHKFESIKSQAEETIARYKIINDLYAKMVIEKPKKKSTSDKLDKILTHKIGGYFIFFLLLMLLFQAIFSWASYPMDWIDKGTNIISELIKTSFSDGPFTRLITDGLIPGLGGVIIFIPQIVILFLFISILEETGYMARVMFIMDKIMRPFGLNGKSVVPLISGAACAVPAIMAARSIDNTKERLLTILVTPLISCSARIPVFTILIGLIIPSYRVLGFLNLQGLVLMALYLLGFLSAIASAWIMKYFLKTDEKDYFIMELPSYRMPRWGNIAITVWQKAISFVWQAGKIIVSISVILWIMASYGPGDSMEISTNKVKTDFKELTEAELNNKIKSAQLEVSYAGHFGKLIEPAIKPLGFDWKIGIALFTSFAAREVFVGTISTIYSIGTDEEGTIIERMKNEKNSEGKPVYTAALVVSLLLFYLFSMQCMSTLAITYKETKEWKWPIIQLFYMTGLAYISSFIAFTLMS